MKITWETVAQLVVLALACYRLTRLAGWDDFPLAARLRGWLIGEETAMVNDLRERIGTLESLRLTRQGVEADLHFEEVDADPLPGYRRPNVAHLVHCPFCIGWWISLTVYLAWLAWPHAVLLGAVPLALSAAVGLIAKNLDP